jgi:hypothetical protein
MHAVAGDVAEDQCAIGGDPDGPLSEAETAAEERLFGGEEVGEAVIIFDTHGGRDCGTSSARKARLDSTMWS